jgi:hypothetical protein
MGKFFYVPTNPNIEQQQSKPSFFFEKKNPVKSDLK